MPLFFQELFQGKAKGFDIRTALLAKSVRDFDQSISMVSHGYHKIEEFYSMASTGNSIGNLKIPVLFVQVCFRLMSNLVGSRIIYKLCTAIMFCVLYETIK